MDDKNFWRDKYRTTTGLRTVGFANKSEQENAREYALGATRFIEYLNSDLPRPQRRTAMELGYGRGFYTKLLKTSGFTRYIGLDIAAPHGPPLGPGFEYRMGDAGVPLDLKEQFDLVMAIDVLFHITDEPRFENALSNLQRHVRPGGVIYVTGRTTDQKLAAHVVHRDLTRFKRLGKLIAVSPWRDTAFLRFRA